jgi:catechol 2,3-dioxygenase-like lactoylglutathione lyase family enzyme
MRESSVFAAIAAALLMTEAAATSRQSAENEQAGPRLYRVILPAKDVAATAKWYEDLLQTTGEFVGPNRVYFRAGPVILALVEPPAGTEARPNQEYLYFAVKDLLPYHERAARLKALDAEMGKVERRPWGEVSFYARDPLGNPLCFVDEKTLFTGRRTSGR